jgi:hypothetical protein
MSDISRAKGGTSTTVFHARRICATVKLQNLTIQHLTGVSRWRRSQ